LRVYVLGSGAGVFSGRRHYVSLLVGTTKGALLVDAGPPIFKRMMEVGAYETLPKAVFLSHYHHDHVGGLFMYLYDLEARGVSELPVILANETTARRLKKALDVFVKQQLHPEIISFSDSGEAELDLGDFRITAIPVRHSVPTHAVALYSKSESKTVFYSSDTAFMEGLAKRVEGFDLCFHEATLPVSEEPRALELGYHSSPRQALEAIRGCKKRALIHISELTFKSWFGQSGEYLVSEDGMLIDV